MSNLVSMKRKRLDTIHKIEIYCKMNNKANATMQHFAKKAQTRKVKPVIKRAVIFDNYLNNVSYVNPNVGELLRQNYANSLKIKNYISAKFSITL